MRRTIENCKVIKKAAKSGIDTPGTEELNDNILCQGYQKSLCDDEPYNGCMECKLNIFYET